MQNNGKLILFPAFVEGMSSFCLRDSGATNICVSSALINKEKLKTKIRTDKIKLANGSVAKCPVIKIKIDTPWISGITEAAVLKNCSAPLIIGNAVGVKPDNSYEIFQQWMNEKQFQSELKPVVLIDDQLIDITDRDITENMKSVTKQETKTVYVQTDIECTPDQSKIPVQNVTVSADIVDSYNESVKIEAVHKRSERFNIGDEVSVCLATDINNQKEWKGPYCIVKKLSNATYKVDIDGKEKIVHIDNIKTCIENKANDIVHVSKSNDDIEHVDKRLIENKQNLDQNNEPKLKFNIAEKAKNK